MTAAFAPPARAPGHGGEVTMGDGELAARLLVVPVAPDRASAG
jgi:hypothetical protein